MKTPGGWECPLEEQYQTPPGFYDTPYIYPFDYDQAAAALLTLAAPGLQVPLDGDSDFVLRRVAGASSLNTTGTAGFQAYDSVRRRFFSQAIDPRQNFSLDLAVVPEKIYPAGGQIWFDIAAFNPAFRVSGPTPASGIFYGQAAFQGVRRFRGVLQQPSYRYLEKPFVYRLPFTLNWNAWAWAGGLPVTPAAPRTFLVPVNDYEFELLGINLIDMATGAYPVALDPPFKMTLYSQSKNAVSKRPVLATYLFANAAAPALGTVYSSLSPGLVYAAGGEIRVEISSLLLAADIAPVAPSYEICFFGVRRIPV